ncbi:MAG TPA: hypothetical protein VN455_13835 [Methanotrichaceae archaeon]|nr:hypothetical protein [Methanotrichaceae archaeon]
MMRQSATYLIVTAICITSASMSPVSGDSNDKAALDLLIEENQNISMGAEEMAFFLDTHGYDAIPKDGYVTINIDDTPKLLPN